MLIRITILFLFFVADSYSQTIKVFEDELGIKGEIRLSGIYSDTILPKQGNVDIRWREKVDNGLKAYYVKGQVKNHLPVGKWIWEEAEWEYSINIGTGLSPSFNVKGRKMKWEGTFNNGIPNGKWTFVVDSILNNGKPNKNLVRIELNYSAGKPFGMISLEDKISKYALTLKGKCDVNGIVEGIWLYQYKNLSGVQVKEERQYQKGLLTEIRITEGNEVSAFRFDENMNFLKNSSEKLKIEGKTIGKLTFEQDEYGGIASELLHENLYQYFLKGWNLEVFPFEFSRNLPVFKRLEYPLNQEEIEYLVASRQLLQKQKNNIEEVLSGNHTIHRSRSVELDTTISFFQLHLSRLNFIDSILNRTDLPFFTYKDRYGGEAQKWIFGLNSMRYKKGDVYDSLEVKIPFITVGTDSVFIFQIFQKLLTQNETTFPRYYKVIEDAHISVKREKILRDLENEIAERYEKQQLFFKEKTGIASLINQKWIKGEVPMLLQKYVQTTDYEEAVYIGKNIMNVLDSIENWQSKTDRFDKMTEELKSKYTYLAYNPYTGENDIAITIKKRFLNVIITDLWPYLLKEIQAENNWDRWILLWNRQFEIFDYLMDFSARDDAHSKRVDKRVRKEKKPERILKIILHQ